MKRLISLAGLAFLLAAGGLWPNDAEARRFGGGRSSGLQRDSVVQRQADPAPPRQNAAQPGQPTNAAPTAAGTAATSAAAPAAAAQHSWRAPIAGLAAGLGLGALASYLGFGEELATFLLIALTLAVVLGAFRVLTPLLFRSHAPPARRFAPSGLAPPLRAPPDVLQNSGPAAAAPVRAGARVPAGFDVDIFLRHAKTNFLRLQAANDRGDVADLREFTSPEMFGEVRLQLAERGETVQQTDVVTLHAELLDVSEEDGRYVASVRFSGLIRELVGTAPVPFDEVWHLTKPGDGDRGWVVAGIQQVE